jgi:hypothetical protein
MASFLIMYSILLITNFQLLVSMLSRGVYSALVSTAVTLGMMVMYVIVNYTSNFSMVNYIALTVEIFSRGDCILSLIINLIVGYTIHVLTNIVLKQHWFPSAYQ